MHYNFTSREAMSAAIEEGRFLEFAQVHTNLYGTRCAFQCLCLRGFVLGFGGCVVGLAWVRVFFLRFLPF